MRSDRWSVVGVRRPRGGRACAAVLATRGSGHLTPALRFGVWNCAGCSETVSSSVPSLPAPRGFTLIELLATITVIGILAALSYGALSAAQEAARESATRATIAKLNSIIMRRYESYLTRRVPISTAGMSPDDAAKDRLYAIRDLMRMEMPDRVADIAIASGGSTVIASPVVLPSSKSVPRPSLLRRYYQYYTSHKSGLASSDTNISGEFLYMIVSLGSPEAMEQFNSSEIGDTNNNGWPEFLDGWGRPIFFLRWAPGFTPYSDIQRRNGTGAGTDEQTEHHDPFDPRRVEPYAYQLFPLIYSAGRDGKFGLNNGNDFNYYTCCAYKCVNSMFSSSEFRKIGEPYADTTENGTLTSFRDNVTNHQLETR